VGVDFHDIILLNKKSGYILVASSNMLSILKDFGAKSQAAVCQSFTQVKV
jgi:hypothetical protein